jgi:hypothetical protein
MAISDVRGAGGYGLTVSLTFKLPFKPRCLELRVLLHCAHKVRKGGAR